MGTPGLVRYPEIPRLSCTIARLGDICWFAFGAVTTLPQCLGTEELWHYVLLLPAIPALLYIAITPLVPESPKHLLITLNQEEKSRKAIEFYYGTDVSVDAIMDEYRLETLHANQSTVGLWEVLNVRHLRWPFLLCVVANVTPRTAAMDIDTYYSTQLITDMGVPIDQAALYNLLFLRLPMILWTIVFIPLSKYCSTSKSLLVTVLVEAVSVSGLCLSEAMPRSNGATVLLIASLATALCAFHLGGQFLPKILPGEICPQVMRSMSTAYATGVTGAASVVITLSFAPLSTIIGESFTLLPLVVISWILCIWLFKYLPDTRDKTINQILAVWIEPDEQDQIIELL